LGQDRYSALTAHDGSYAFEKIAAGDYVLTVHSPDRLMDETLEVTVSPPESRFDVALTVAEIEGRATDPEGRPLPGLRVDVRAPGRRGRNSRIQGSMTVSEDERGNLRQDWDSGSRRITTDGEGRYRLRGLATEVPLVVSVSGQYVVADSRDGIELSVGEIRRRVDFELQAAGAIEVRVNGRQGSYRVVAVREGARQSSWIWNSRPARMTGMATGLWTVKVTSQDDSGGGQEVTREVEILPGETIRVTLDVP
jgi:hypothetical protein